MLLGFTFLLNLASEHFLARAKRLGGQGPMRTLAAADRGQALHVLAGLSVLLMAAALVVILGPMLYGAGAVVFRGTVEFRRLEWQEHGRGDGAAD